MTDAYEIYEYKYKVKLFMYIYFYAREDKTANEMKELYEKTYGVKIKLKHKKFGYIPTPPYEKELEQLELLRKGEMKYGNK